MATREKTPRNRVVASDLSKVQFSAPSAGGGANLPGLRTRDSTNNMLQSFAGFTKTLQGIAIVREKNDAAKEALEARNKALEGKYSTFQRQESVDIYEQTRGNIKGRSAIVGLQEGLDAGTTDILNQNLSLKGTLEAYDSMKSELINEKFEGDLNRSEAYKSGFLPHVVDSIEKNRVALAQAHKAKFVAEQKTDQREHIQNQLNDKLQEETIGVAGNVVKSYPFYTQEDFLNARAVGVNLGLTREQATTNALENIAEIAVFTNNPDILEFAFKKLPGGGSLTNDPELAKLLRGAFDKARSGRIADAARVSNLETQMMNKRSESIKVDWMGKLLDNPNVNHDEEFRQLVSSGKLNSADIGSLVTFKSSIAKGDSHIVEDPSMITDLEIRAASGELTFDELKTKMNQSVATGRGITFSQFSSILPKLTSASNKKAAVNAYTTNVSAVTNFFGDDEFIEDRFKSFGLDEDFDIKTLQSDMLFLMKNSATLFYRETGETDLNSPKAFKWFGDFKQHVLNMVPNKRKERRDLEDIQKPLSQMGITFDDEGNVEQSSIAKARENKISFWDKWFQDKKKLAERKAEFDKEVIPNSSDDYESKIEVYQDLYGKIHNVKRRADEWAKMKRDMLNGTR